MKIRNKAMGLVVAVTTVLTACGGGGGDSTTPAATPSTLGGTAAVGFPIVGAKVKVTCAGGNALTSQPTSSTGAWQVTLSGQTFPCAAQVTDGTINNVVNTTPYHSIALNSGLLNVTPLTDLVVANMVQSAALNSWFTALTSSALAQIDAAKITAAMNLVQTQLSLTQLGTTINPMTSSFTPAAGSVMDDTLTALSNALKPTVASAPMTYADLLTQAGTGAGFTAPAGFATKMVTAYSGTSSGTTSAGTSSGGANATLTTSRNSSGLTQNGNTVNNVTVPMSQTAFCADKTVLAALNSSIGFMGNLQITSCSFSGLTGKIGVMIDLGVGMGYTTSGSVNFTYTVTDSTGGTNVSTLPAGFVSQGGLAWMPVTSTLYTYAQAVTLCSTTINGLSGWRMPTLQELNSLATSGASNGQGWVVPGDLWSSTVYPNNVNAYWVVYLPNPTLLGFAIAGNSQAATCVR